MLTEAHFEDKAEGATEVMRATGLHPPFPKRNFAFALFPIHTKMILRKI